MAQDLQERLVKYRHEIGSLQDFLLHEEYPANCTINQRRILRRQKEHHMIKENKLYRKRKGNWVEIITTPGEVNDILKYYHVTSGYHSAVANTKYRIANIYYWFGMSKDVDEYVLNCATCQPFELELESTQAAAPRQTKISRPMQVVGLDLIGPLPVTGSGSEYILSLVDYLTKYVMVFALAREDGSGVNTCIKHYISILGAPERLISDQGKRFCDKINYDLCKEMGIKRCVSRAHHPQIKALVEKVNKMVTVRVCKLMVDRGPDWDQTLHDVVFSINSQRQSSTKHTPFFLMFGREAYTLMETKGVDGDTDIVGRRRLRLCDAECNTSAGNNKILEITKQDTVKLADTRVGQEGVPLPQMVAVQQLKPAKPGARHRHSEELVTDSCTDTDPELPENEEAYQREQSMAKPVHVAAPPQPHSKRVSQPGTGQPDSLIGTKAKAERSQVSATKVGH
ncbi:Gypsy retrotransposon integrase-like protein 1 [Chionoecetes opilio]|uniref:RNA-directed DNA polymerase n=1 Tax=Chionoecetes opilio TaxID=41210 RepID=A0A8J5CK20_CHIOP|nr:Gypsy retrotransposon integrase-like protein 1 [Chionoecetes opilio]